MSGWLIVGTAVVMVVGIAGTVVPVLPGVLLVWGAAVASWFVHGWNTAGVVSVVVITILAVIGTVAQVVLPHRAGLARGVARNSMLLGLAAAGVGFFVVPVIGFPLFFVLGVLLAEQARLGSMQEARAVTVAMLKGWGIGVLVEAGVAVTIAAIWLVTVLVAT